MTWGSNATYHKTPCPHCGVEMVDDDDDLGFTHLRSCPKRPVSWFRKLFPKADPIAGQTCSHLQCGKPAVARQWREGMGAGIWWYDCEAHRGR
jgi:hypothetical protein